MFASIRRAAQRGIALKEHRFGALAPVEPATAQLLRSYHPWVAAHRAGNALERLSQAYELGAWLETDVRVHRGAFVVEHEHRLGPLSYDLTRWLLRLGAPPFRLELVLEEAKRLGARLLVDLKIDATWVPALLGVLRRYELLERSAFTGRWEALDVVMRDCRSNRDLYYGDLDREWKLERFLSEQHRTHRPGASIRLDLATPQNVGRLHETGASVAVYVVTSGEEALAALQAGTDGLITNNLSLASVWGAAVSGSGRDALPAEA